MWPRRSRSSTNPASTSLASTTSARTAPARGGWRIVKSYMRIGVRRLSRLRASPHEIALGCAIGAFASITPLLGAQTIIAVALTALVRANIPAAILGTFVGNPLSWPFIWASTYAVGLKIIGFEGVFDPNALGHNALQLWAAFLENSPQLLDATTALLRPLLLPMLAGSLPIGLFTAAIVYYISKSVVLAWRTRRMHHASASGDWLRSR
jgi:uncharacterized protein (DUF2062 family)